MRVRMLRAITGTRNGQAYPSVGEIMVLPEADTAHDLLYNKYAELVPDKPVIETAMVAPPENSARRTTRPKPRMRQKG